MPRSVSLPETPRKLAGISAWRTASPFGPVLALKGMRVLPNVSCPSRATSSNGLPVIGCRLERISGTVHREPPAAAVQHATRRRVGQLWPPPQHPPILPRPTAVDNEG